MKHFTFFIRQALLQMNRNRQRTLFVLFCIAAGVASVVALRNVGLMLGDALTGDFQAENQGDMVVTATALGVFTTGEIDEDLIEQDQPFAPITFSDEGLDRITTWADENGYDVMLANRNQNTLQVRPAGASTLSQELASVYLVDPDQYPYYSETPILEPEGITLAEALREPNSIVISEDLATKTEVEVGDELRISGSVEPFVVTAIMDNASEASIQNLQSLLFPYTYLSYETGLDLYDAKADTVYVRVPEGSDITAIEESFNEDFIGLPTRTTADIAEANENISGGVTRLITTLGLVALLIGGIGIINTMIVVVGRRMVEIGVLKTIGLQGRQITFMFLIEAFILGVFGSVLGVLVGIGLVAVLQRVVENTFSESLTFTVFPEAVLMGLVTGTVVTVVFGFLPTLSAGRVRPNVVLNPTNATMPSASIPLTLISVVVMTTIMGLLVGIVVENILIGMGMAFGALVVLGVAIILLWLFVFFLSVLPSFGSISIKLAQRAMGTHRIRTASTLLGLVVGMFSLSLILLFTRTLINAVSEVSELQFGGNVIAQPQTFEDSIPLDEKIAELGLEEVERDQLYAAEIIAINGNDDMEAIMASASEAGQATFPTQNSQEEAGEDEDESSGGFFANIDPVQIQIDLFFQTFILDVAREDTPEYEVDTGEAVTVDSEKAIFLPGNMALEWLGIEVGSTLTVRYDNGEEATLTVAGLAPMPDQSGFSVNAGPAYPLVSPDSIAESVNPTAITYALEVPEEDIDFVVAELSDVPDVLVLETSQFNAFIARLFNQIARLPLVIAVLALFASGVIMANTVSLATLERRREIGIMKAVGLQSGRVLGLLLLENGFVGLLGGVIGTGIGAVFILISGLVAQDVSTFPLFTLLLLILLSVAVTLVATAITAYGASREKPLIVLRYE